MHEPRIKANMAYGFMFCAGRRRPLRFRYRRRCVYRQRFDCVPYTGWNSGFVSNEISARKVGFYKMDACNYATIDSLVLCMFVELRPEGNAELLKAVTGWDTGIGELLRIGERVLTTMRYSICGKVLLTLTILYRNVLSRLKPTVLVSKTQLDHAKIDMVRKYYYTLNGLGCPWRAAAGKGRGTLYRITAPDRR